MTEKIKPKDKPHYVNNKEFSQAVVDYVKQVRDAEAAGKPLPIVPDYIAQCFTYREEMVMDAVENCLKAVLNYKIETATRTGNPNAFAYFTQICYFAFLRRLQKEKKQQDIKFKFIEEAGIEDFIQMGDDNVDYSGEMAYVDQLRGRIEKVKVHDQALKDFAKEEKRKEKEAKGLELFMS